MKKILTMILSLALVLSMIPATASVAFAASGSGEVKIGETTYNVTANPATFNYTGQSQVPPTVSLTPQNGGAPLNTQYTVKYKKTDTNQESSTITEVGTYKILITLSGETTSTESTCEVEINAADASAAEIRNIISIQELAATESKKVEDNPDQYFAVYLHNNRLEKSDVKLTCTFDSTSKTYTVTAGASNANYSLNKTKTFSINANDLATAGIRFDKKTFTYNGVKQTPNITVTDSAKNLLKENKDYKITYLNGSGQSVNEPTDVGTYSVKIEPATGSSYTGTQQSDEKFTISALSLKDKNVTVTYDSRTQDIKEVKYGRTTIPPANYTVAGTAKTYFTVTGKDNLKDTRRVHASQKNIANCTVTFSDNRTSSVYNNTAVKPKVTVKDTAFSPAYTLIENTATSGTQVEDYSVEYQDANGKVVSSFINVGTYKVIVTGEGSNYYGKQTLTYTITGTDISKYTVILRETTVTADGTAKTPVITKVAYGSSSLSSSDYTVSYQDSTGKTVTRLIEPGTYKVVVTGKNGYSGSCYATYTILGLTQSITGIKNYYKVYPTTQPFKLDPQAAEKTGFTFTSSDPTVASVDAYGYVTMHKPGRAKITITTKGTVKYNQATTSTEIRVYPNKVTMSRKPWTTGKKGQIKVRWNKRVGATRYEIRYSRQKSFKKGSYKTKKATAAVNSYSTQSTTVSGLRKGYTYYVKVRAVTQVYDDYGQKVNYYGNWSKTKTVKVK